MRTTLIVIVAFIAACSGEPADDDVKVINNNSTTNNGGTNTSTGPNNVGTNNAQSNNNATTPTNNTNNGLPRAPFAGVCEEPRFSPADRGCAYSWRCAVALELDCIAGRGPGSVTCSCSNDGAKANSWSGEHTEVCSGDLDAISELVADECGWDLTYGSVLRCDPAMPVGDGSDCTWEWTCGASTVAIECATDATGGRHCTCVEDGQPTRNVFPVRADPCLSAEADVIRLVNAGCGWDIMTD